MPITVDFHIKREIEKSRIRIYPCYYKRLLCFGVWHLQEGALTCVIPQDKGLFTLHAHQTGIIVRRIRR